MSNIEDLPLEILFIVFEYLAPMPPPGVGIATHPFLVISRTCHALRSSLEPFLRIQILNSNAKQLEAHIDALANGNDNITLPRHKFLKAWLSATMKHCFACGKASSRRAIMDLSLVCCARCDRIVWASKITMSEAMKKYSLRKDELFGGMLPSTLGGPPEVAMTEDGIIPQRKGLHYGQFMSNNTFTTMFVEEDVAKMASDKHGIVDMQQFLDSKLDKSEMRRVKMEANKQKKENYNFRLAQANGLDPTVYAHRIRLSLNERKGSTPMSLVRGDMLLKKLGVTFESPGPLNANCDYYYKMAVSESKCYLYVTRLMQQNRFYRAYSRSALDWGGEECRFHRRLFVLRTHDLEREGQYVYQDDIITDVRGDFRDDESYLMDDDDLDPFLLQEDEAALQLALSEPSVASGVEGYRAHLPDVAPALEDSEIEVIPIKNFSPEFEDEELQQLVYWRKGDGDSAFQPMVYTEYGKTKPVSLVEWADPVDYCLFEAFLIEFAVDSVDPPMLSYTELREIWNPKDTIKTKPDSEGPIPYSDPAEEACTPFSAPWSWTRYPVYIEDVTYDNFGPAPPPPSTNPYGYGAGPSGTAAGYNNDEEEPSSSGDEQYLYFTAAEKAARAIQKAARVRQRQKTQQELDAKKPKEEAKTVARNDKVRKEHERMGDAIRAVVKKSGWDLLGEKEAWDRAVEDELVGKGKGRARGAAKTRATRSRKGKEKVVAEE